MKNLMKILFLLTIAIFKNNNCDLTGLIKLVNNQGIEVYICESENAQENFNNIIAPCVQDASFAFVPQNIFDQNKLIKNIHEALQEGMKNLMISLPSDNAYGIINYNMNLVVNYLKQKLGFKFKFFSSGPINKELLKTLLDFYKRPENPAVAQTSKEEENPNTQKTIVVVKNECSLPTSDFKLPEQHLLAPTVSPVLHSLHLSRTDTPNEIQAALVKACFKMLNENEKDQKYQDEKD